MASYRPIACGDYDVLELACTFEYEIDLCLDKEHIVGTAVTLQTEPLGEYLIVRIAGGETASIRIDQIQRLVVMTRPARFDSHTFLSA